MTPVDASSRNCQCFKHLSLVFAAATSTLRSFRLGLGAAKEEVEHDRKLAILRYKERTQVKCDLRSLCKPRKRITRVPLLTTTILMNKDVMKMAARRHIAGDDGGGDHGHARGVGNECFLGRIFSNGSTMPGFWPDRRISELWHPTSTIIACKGLSIVWQCYSLASLAHTIILLFVYTKSAVHYPLNYFAIVLGRHIL